jgi:hypothetical protein
MTKKHSMHSDPQKWPAQVCDDAEHAVPGNEAPVNKAQLSPKQPADNQPALAKTMPAKTPSGKTGSTKPSPQGNTLSKKSPADSAD